MDKQVEKTEKSDKKENEISEELLKVLKKGQEIGIVNFETKDAETYYRRT